MTNKTEMVSVPRELLERLAKEIDHLLGFTYAANVEECRVEVDALIALLAAPAEDVRAVVEEPVAFDEEFQRAKFIQNFKLDGRIYFDSTTKQWLPTRDSIEGFQMAERVAGLWIGWRTCAEKWNACLDAVEELNKC